MIEVSSRLVFLIVLVAVVGFFLWRDRDKVERHSILFYRRTQKGVELIDRIASLSPRFWSIYGWAGVVLGVISIPLVLIQAGAAIANMVSTGSTAGGPALIAPGLSGSASFQSGISFIPIEYWVISIVVLMVVHEFSHGIVARAEGFDINSVGWVIFGIIPGAFVEPKGEGMLPGAEGEVSGEGLWDQGDWKSRLKVLSAGSFANYLTALVFLGLALVLFTNVTQPVGVQYYAQEGMPANESGMSSGIIYEINGERVRYSSELMEIGNSISPGENVTLWTSEGNFTVTTTSVNNSDSGYIGIMMPRDTGLVSTVIAMVSNSNVIKPAYQSYEGLLSWSISLLEMVALLNFVVGFFNMLPAKPLDGGQVIDTLLNRFAPGGLTALNYWSLFVWMLLLGSIIVSIFAGVL